MSLALARGERAPASLRRLRTAKAALLTGMGLAPFAGFIFLFLLLPVAKMIAGAFVLGQGGVGTDNFRRALSPQYLGAFRTSIGISLETALLGALVGTVVAYAIVQGAAQRRRGFVVAFCTVTSNFAGVPLAFAFITTLGAVGWVTLLVERVFHVNLYTDLGFAIYSYYGLVIVYTYFQLPLMVLLAVPAINGLRREWREAAQNLGASSWQYWRDVGLPVLTPALVGACALLFANAFGAYATAYSLSSGAINLVPLRIGTLINGDVNFDAGLANALGVGMTVVIAGAILVYQWANRSARRWMR
jgi:putative spermidine/putrescine transport system permease protein